jgi:transcriptional regulator with XRE-family HTH domain
VGKQDEQEEQGPSGGVIIKIEPKPSQNKSVMIEGSALKGTLREAAGARIRRRRNELGLTNQSAFCKLVGISQSSFSEIERGKTKLPSAKHLKKLSSALNVSDEWIIYGDGAAELPADDETADLLRAIKTLSVEEKRAVYAIVKQLSKK